MTPVTQTKVVVKNSNGDFVVRGNCLAAAIASLLDIQITEVPNIEVLYELPGHFWDTVMSKWLEFKGYQISAAPQYGVFHNDGHHYPEGTADSLKYDYYLGSGQSVRGVSHICIFKAGELIHDPHPTREGIGPIQCFQRLERIEDTLVYKLKKAMMESQDDIPCSMPSPPKEPFN